MGAGLCFRSSRTAGQRAWPLNSAAHHNLLAALRGGDLQAAGLLEVVHLVEGVGDGAAVARGVGPRAAIQGARRQT